MILLDTNVLSALMRERPNKEVLDWLDRQPRISIWTTSITIFEIEHGLQRLAAGKKRSTLMERFTTVLEDRLDHRVAQLDEAAGHEAGRLMALRESKGRPAELRDTFIAGIALARRASIATRNVQHFDDLPVPVINPWQA